MKREEWVAATTRLLDSTREYFKPGENKTLLDFISTAGDKMEPLWDNDTDELVSNDD